jgi:hypothetical protein
VLGSVGEGAAVVVAVVVVAGVVEVVDVVGACTQT